MRVRVGNKKNEKDMKGLKWLQLSFKTENDIYPLGEHKMRFYFGPQQSLVQG